MSEEIDIFEAGKKKSGKIAKRLCKSYKHHIYFPKTTPHQGSSQPTLQPRFYHRAINPPTLAEVALVLHHLKPAETKLGNPDPNTRMFSLNSVQWHWGFSTWV